MAQMVYKYAIMDVIGEFVPAPDPNVGEERKPEMEGVERVELRNAAGGLTGHIAYMVSSPTGSVGVIPGEILAKDSEGAVHVLAVDPVTRIMADKSNGAGPYVSGEAAPAPAEPVADPSKLN